MSRAEQPWTDPRVAATRVAGAAYDDGAVADAVRALGTSLGWDDGERGALGAVIPAGARVLVKPNLVLHANQGPWGNEPLVTHPSLVRAVAEEALRASPSSLAVGDAPLQACDFGALMDAMGLGAWGEALAARDPRFGGVHDFRRTRSVVAGGCGMRRKTRSRWTPSYSSTWRAKASWSR